MSSTTRQASLVSNCVCDTVLCSRCACQLDSMDCQLSGNGPWALLSESVVNGTLPATAVEDDEIDRRDDQFVVLLRFHPATGLVARLDVLAAVVRGSASVAALVEVNPQDASYGGDTLDPDGVLDAAPGADAHGATLHVALVLRVECALVAGQCFASTLAGVVPVLGNAGTPMHVIVNASLPAPPMVMGGTGATAPWPPQEGVWNSSAVAIHWAVVLSAGGHVTVHDATLGPTRGLVVSLQSRAASSSSSLVARRLPAWIDPPQLDDESLRSSALVFLQQRQAAELGNWPLTLGTVVLSPVGAVTHVGTQLLHGEREVVMSGASTLPTPVSLLATPYELFVAVPDLRDIASPRLTVGTDLCPVPALHAATTKLHLCFSCAVLHWPCTVRLWVDGVLAVGNYTNGDGTLVVRANSSALSSPTQSGGVRVDLAEVSTRFRQSASLVATALRVEAVDVFGHATGSTLDFVYDPVPPEASFHPAPPVVVNSSAPVVSAACSKSGCGFSYLVVPGVSTSAHAIAGMASAPGWQEGLEMPADPPSDAVAALLVPHIAVAPSRVTLARQATFKFRLGVDSEPQTTQAVELHAIASLMLRGVSVSVDGGEPLVLSPTARSITIHVGLGSHLATVRTLLTTGGYLSSPLLYAWTVTDDRREQLLFASNWVGFRSTPLAVTALDSATFAFMVSRTPSELQFALDCPADQLAADSNARVWFDASNATAASQCVWHSTTMAQPLMLAGLESGSHTLAVRGRDRFHDVSRAATFTWLARAPTAFRVRPPPSALCADNTTFALRVGLGGIVNASSLQRQQDTAAVVHTSWRVDTRPPVGVVTVVSAAYTSESHAHLRLCSDTQELASIELVLHAPNWTSTRAWFLDMWDVRPHTTPRAASQGEPQDALPTMTPWRRRDAATSAGASLWCTDAAITDAAFRGEGVYTAEVVLEDRVRHTKRGNASWIVDTTSPAAVKPARQPAHMVVPTPVNVSMSLDVSEAQCTVRVAVVAVGTAFASLEGLSWTLAGSSGSVPTHSGAFTTPLLVSMPGDGAWTVFVQLEDRAGLVSMLDTLGVVITVDTTPPETAVVWAPVAVDGTVGFASAAAQVANASHSTTIQLQPSANEPGCSFEVAVHNAAGTAGSWSVATAPTTDVVLAGGWSEVHVRAVDAAGNVDATAAVLHVLVDVVPPAFAVSTWSAVVREPSAGYVTVHASEAVSLHVSTADTDVPAGESSTVQSVGQFAWAWSPAHLTDGTHELCVSVSDVAGNAGQGVGVGDAAALLVLTGQSSGTGQTTPQQSVCVSIVVDATAPRTWFVDKPAALNPHNPPTFNVAVSETSNVNISAVVDGMTVPVTVHGGVNSGGLATPGAEWLATLQLPMLGDDVHNVVVHAVDAVGNAAYPLSWSWTQDTVGATVAWLDAVDAIWSTPSSTLRVACNDSAGCLGVQWRVDAIGDATPTTCSTGGSGGDTGSGWRDAESQGAGSAWGFGVGPLGDGEYSVVTRGVDMVGNAGDAVTALLRIDTTPPPAPRFILAPSAVDRSTAPTFRVAVSLPGQDNFVGDVEEIHTFLEATTVANGQRRVSIDDPVWNVTAVTQQHIAQGHVDLTVPVTTEGSYVRTLCPRRCRFLHVACHSLHAPS